MIRWRRGVIVRVRGERAGTADYDVRVDGDLGAGSGRGIAPVCRALAYVDVVGRGEVGDEVLLNVSALWRGLGTGGSAMVVAIPSRLPGDAPPGPGHLVKARYTPLQTMVLGADEQESPFHDVLAEADSLDGMPVVTADLHSALPAIVAGMRATDPGLRVAYVMTDGGALPAAFSRTVLGLREAGWITDCITAGQAYGGDHEAVSVHSALLVARLVCRADVTVMAQGPGNLGTGTRWGFSGVALGEAVNAVSTLGGRPVASLRVSQADARERHRGVSHHSLTAYGRVALAPADLPLPASPPETPIWGRVREQVDALVRSSAGRLTRVDIPTQGLDKALRQAPVPLSTMGRGLDEDYAAFLAAAVAGRHAAILAGSPDHTA